MRWENKVHFDCLLSRQHLCQKLSQSNRVCKDYSKSNCGTVFETVYIASLDLSKAISRKRCKIGGKLVITNSKSYMSFGLVQKSVNLNDLERPLFCYFIEFGTIASGAHCVKVTEDVVVILNFTFAISSPDEFLV